MQKWIKAKPNRTGFWWALDTNVASVVEVINIPNPDGSECLMGDTGEDYLPLSSRYFSNFLWGSAKLTEPYAGKL